MTTTTVNTWTYIHSETGWTNEHGEYIPGLWTVGHTDTTGRWHPESDHGSPGAAAARVHWLNGGQPGICGARLHTTSSYDGAHRLYVCTKPPGHTQAGDPDHYDGVIDAPAARWRDPEPDVDSATWTPEEHQS